jgi:hypothetical protein
MQHPTRQRSFGRGLWHAYESGVNVTIAWWGAHGRQSYLLRNSLRSKVRSRMDKAGSASSSRVGPDGGRRLRRFLLCLWVCWYLLQDCKLMWKWLVCIEHSGKSWHNLALCILRIPLRYFEYRKMDATIWWSVTVNGKQRRKFTMSSSICYNTFYPTYQSGHSTKIRDVEAAAKIAIAGYQNNDQRRNSSSVPQSLQHQSIPHWNKKYIAPTRIKCVVCLTKLQKNSIQLWRPTPIWH